jgi:hypothetical protein
MRLEPAAYLLPEASHLRRFWRRDAAMAVRRTWCILIIWQQAAACALLGEVRESTCL